MSLLPIGIRGDFPILDGADNPQPLIYLDSAATSLKPRVVIEAVTGFYTSYTANVHRAVHGLSEEATQRYEASRESIAHLIGADSREIAFTKNATEALNLLALNQHQDCRVSVAPTEHHSNLLPWRRFNSTALPLDQTRRIDVAALPAHIAEHTPDIVTFATISNGLGVTQPTTRIIEELGNSAAVILDLSQSVGHESIDLIELNPDYACFSGHKMLGPSGVGVLYKNEAATALSPIYLGGEMVHQVSLTDYEPRPWPWCMEAGTPNIEGVIGLGAAAEYLLGIGVDAIEEHCHQLANQLRQGLTSIPDITLTAPTADSGLVSFSVEGYGAHGISKILSNRFNIMVRSGFHCTQPLHELFGLPETVRASFHLYNTEAEVDALIVALKTIVETR